MNTSGGKLIFEVDSPEMYNLIPNNQYFYDAFLGVPLYKTIGGVIVNPWIDSGGDISGLSTGYIPKATSATSIGNSWLYQDGNFIKITTGKAIASPNGLNDITLNNSGLTVTSDAIAGGGGIGYLQVSGQSVVMTISPDGEIIRGYADLGPTQYILRHTNIVDIGVANVAGTILSRIAFDQSSANMSFDNGVGANGSVYVAINSAGIQHTDEIILDAPVYNFASATASFIPFIDSANNMVASYLSQDASYIYVADTKNFSSINGQTILSFGSGALATFSFNDNESPFGSGNLGIDGNQIGIYHNNGLSGAMGSVMIQNDVNNRVLISHSAKVQIDAGTDFNVTAISDIEMEATATFGAIGLDVLIIGTETITLQAGDGVLKATGLEIYASNVDAILGGLTTDCIYKTVTGELRIVV